MELFFGRHQIFVRNDLEHAVGEGAFDPKGAAVPVFGPGLFAFGDDQVLRTFDQIHPRTIAVQLQDCAG